MKGSSFLSTSPFYKTYIHTEIGSLFMKKIVLLSVGGLLMLTTTAHAESNHTMMRRGGLGFIYTDFNSFNNVGEFALDRGVAVQVEGTSTLNAASSTSSTQPSTPGGTVSTTTSGNVITAEPSLVMSNGKVGFGIKDDRSGSNLTTSGNYTDVLEAGLGAALIKDRVTLGVDYSKTISGTSPDNGVIGADLTIQGANHAGAAIAFGASQELSAVTGTNLTVAKGGIGYGFKSHSSIEADVTFNNVMNNSKDYTLSAFFNTEAKVIYFSGGAQWQALSEVTSALGRLGFVLGKYVDFSVVGSFPFASGSNPTLGGTFRVAF
jgi:hypothetical protein